MNKMKETKIEKNWFVKPVVHMHTVNQKKRKKEIDVMRERVIKYVVSLCASTRKKVINKCCGLISVETARTGK